ncbi:hypothetical protein U9K52_09865 [Chryseobacterium sp. MHB01]|uniref:hypothetical protein n=1 Tax=Chryseobacterium sp. MHB01 TaxID=3109433 RepID=UPI002AFDDC1A|nr:hypothetical protein [Chryseobacterium sp. MHB01]MEA1849218.1 hypothetical protein [Chryseobacterium sp. MHB01]
MHTEKIKIFDEYARTKGFNDWNDLKSECDENLMTEDEFLIFMFEACDLVQKEQQKRIAQKATVKHTEFKPEKVSGSSRAIGNGSQVFSVDQSSILSENNLIK